MAAPPRPGTLSLPALVPAPRVLIVAAPFYRATAVDPLGIDFRRRYTLDDGKITAYLDEHLDDRIELEYELINKPFTMQKLVKIVSEALS